MRRTDRPAGTPLLTLELRYEQDLVSARQRARQVAALLGFDGQDQTRVTTAVSEIARNAFEYAGGGRVEFALDAAGSAGSAAAMTVRVSDRGPGIADVRAVLDGRHVSESGMGLGITGARRLMDRFDIESGPGAGTVVTLAKDLPRRGLGPASPPSSPAEAAEAAARIAAELARSSAQSPLEEVRFQNQELLRTLAELQESQAELDQLNRELSDTNRGVMALYAELDDKAQQLQHANELKTTFLSNVSHEFRTPLNSIMGLAGLLLDRADGDLTPEQEKQVAFIRRSAASLAEMVNDLLDTAKIEAGKVTVEPQEFLVADLFSSLRGVFRPLLRSEEVALVFADASPLPPLHTDDGKVAQILRNLISNALKFTERGSVRVSAELVPAVGHAGGGDGPLVVFTVTDTGIGIAPDDRARVFEDFGQVGGALQRQAKGTGLGLPLSRRLAEILGGSLVLESSAPGAGSAFRLVVPQVYRGPMDVIILKTDGPAVTAQGAGSDDGRQAPHG